MNNPGIASTASSPGLTRKPATGQLPAIGQPVQPPAAPAGAPPVLGDQVTMKSGTGKLTSLSELPRAAPAPAPIPVATPGTKAPAPYQADLDRLLKEFANNPELKAKISSFARLFPEAEAGSLYAEIARTLDVKPRQEFGNVPDGHDLARRIILQISSPDSMIFQGNGSTSCTSASLQVIIARSSPGKYARIARELFTSGTIGLELGAKKFRLRIKSGDFLKAPEGRGPVSNAFQSAFERLMHISPGQGASATKFNSLYRMITGEEAVNVVPDEAVLKDLSKGSMWSGFLNVPVLMKPESTGEMGHSLVICRVNKKGVLLDDPASTARILMPLQEFLDKAACIIMSPRRTRTKQNYIDNVVTGDFGGRSAKTLKASLA